MPRRKVTPPTISGPDPRYNNVAVTKFIRRMMVDGKKSTTTRVMYEAMELVGKNSQKDPVEVFTKALENVKPALEVKSRRVGGSTYQVPVEIRESRREALAMRWIINAARSRAGKSMSQKLSSEMLDAFNATGTAFKKKEDTHRMAEANRAFAHYRW